MTQDKAVKKYGWGKLGVPACCVMKHRRSIPDNEDFYATENELKEFFASISKRQTRLLCEIADQVGDVEQTPLH
jgi:hypothetical protein